MTNSTSDKIIVWGIGSTRAMRVHWTLAEFGLDYEVKPIRSRTGETQTAEYLALNPKGKIPVLCHGPLVLSESAAIIEYLTGTFPPPADFFVPTDATDRAKLYEWCFFVMTELDAHSLYLIRRHHGLKEIYGAAPEAVASAREYFLKQINAVADLVSAAGAYLMGNKLSIADIILMTCLDWAILYDIDLPPALRAYHERVAVRPKYQQAMRLTYPEKFTENV